MRKTTGGLLLLLLSALTLSGCLVLRSEGPCYGVGCRAFTTPQASGQAQSAASPNAPAQNAQSAAGQNPSAAPSSKKPHGFHALLKKIKL
jgi:hypothetical protein